MRRFLKNVLFFVIPFLLLFIGVEVYLEQYPSTFQLKVKYINSNKNIIEILILGSSHNQNAINPEYLSNFKSANLAFGSQDLQLDNKLLEKYISQLPHLKYVILELSYYTLEYKNDNNYERNNLYLRFYHINNFGRKTNILDYSIFLSNPKLNLFIKKTAVNKYGFATELSKFEKEFNRFKNLNYDENLIKKDTDNIIITRHKYENIIAYNENIKIFENMIKLCIRNNVKPIILIPPVYISYYEEMLPKKKQRRDDFAKYIIEKYSSVILFNFEYSNNFLVTEFKNEDHLNPAGAEKFTKIIDNLLNNYEK